MSSELKVIPDKFRDVVCLRENVETHFEKLPRLRRRAIWAGISSLLKQGLFAAKMKLKPHFHMPVDDGVYIFGAINHGNCVTVIGISSQKLTLYSVLDKLRLLRRAGQPEFCTILDEKIGKSTPGRIKVVVAEYQFIVWAAFVGMKEAAKQYLMELLPEKMMPVWQQDRALLRA